MSLLSKFENKKKVNDIFPENNRYINFEKLVEIQNQEIELPILKEKGIKLFIKREDSIHSFVSGNKFRKLKYNILEAKNLHKETLLTFGGAFSNHIVATAFAASAYGLKSIGIIRGDELGLDLNKTLTQNTTLQKAKDYGMEFCFISRENYRKKNEINFIKDLEQKFGNFYLIPEGGTNKLAIKGCEEILTKKDSQFNYICVSVGTGGTIAGLINASKKHQEVIGFPALKGDFLTNEIKKYTLKKNWRLNTNYHFGGYGKYKPSLVDFINDFSIKTKILLDPIYTGKLIIGILDMVEQNIFSKGTKILAIHTGGLQGISGFNQKLQNKNQKQIHLL